MNPIRTNKPVFFADDGEPLASGYIYVGLPGQDPRNFPKTVTFRDSGGGEFTASQPLRTNGQGQISYNGKAIIALVEGDYSLLIEDRTGTQTKSGWTPTVSNTTPSGGGGGGGVVGVKSGVLLGDIKLLDVTPGDIVINAGKTGATDRLGAEWLVVSNTGSPGDDTNLIDFANATQGRRIRNQIYHKDVLATGQFLFDTPIIALATSSVGAFNGVWGNISLPSIPAEASSAIVRVSLFGSNGSGTIANIVAYARKPGTGAAADASTKIGRATNSVNTATSISVAFVSEITIPLPAGASKSFDLYLTGTPSMTLEVALVGYTTNARSVV